MHLLFDGLKVSFLHYPYPLLFPLLRFDPIHVADERDIACMKVDAIANRGSRRDFIDLYVAATRHGLGQIAEWFASKFAAIPYNRVHVLKALTYFVDAEEDPPPDLVVSLDWGTVKDFFLSEVPRLARLS